MVVLLRVLSYVPTIVFETHQSYESKAITVARACVLHYRLPRASTDYFLHAFRPIHF